VSNLHEELDAALAAITPREAPVEAAMRRGRRLRLRRRLAAVAGVAAVAVFAATGYPALTPRAGGPAPAPSVPRHQRVVVTVTPPAPGSPDNGLIALGTIGAKRWQVSISAGPPPYCILGQVATFDMNGGCIDSGMLDAPSDESPLTMQGHSAGSYTVAVGAVATSVTYIVVTLTDGQQLKLIPVTSYGHRYVGYMTPRGLRAARVTAYLASGQELISIPFQPPGFEVPDPVRWAPPGAPEPRTATAVIGSGTAGGRHWSMTAYVGPWGTCVAWGSGGACWPFTQMPSSETIGFSGDAGQYILGSAAAPAATVKVTLTDGTSSLVPVRAAGDERLWVFALPQGQQLKRWIAYDAAGRQVAASPG
jgi:hypothetical protein